MKKPDIIPSAQCIRILDFGPQQIWPAILPGVAVGKILIAGFDRDLCLNYEWEPCLAKGSVSPASIAEFCKLFTEFYPHLSFAELVILRNLLNKISWSNLRETSLSNLGTNDSRCSHEILYSLALHYGYRDFELFLRVGEVLSRSSESFVRWSAERKVSPGDLQPLLALDDFSKLESGLNKIVSSECTRQEGVRALELIVDLILLNEKSEQHSGNEPELNKVFQSETWIVELQALRNPETTKSDSKIKTWVSGQIWPRASQVRWSRQGDRTGIEVKFFVQQKQDFEKSRLSIDKIQQILEDSPHGLWRQN